MSASAGGGKPQGARNVKKGYELDQKRRVRDAIDKQRNARKEKMDLLRRLGGEAQGAETTGDAATPEKEERPHADDSMEGDDGVRSSGGSRGGGRGGRRGRAWEDAEDEKYRGQLMMPEWMIAAPDGLSSSWLVCARPEGKRCLVVASGGRTVSRLRNGKVLHTFQSALPNGGHFGTSGGIRGRVGGSDFSILDCVYCESPSCYYICDVVCWKGHAVDDCSAEFRLFWLQQKLAEDAPGLAESGMEGGAHSFSPVHWMVADQAGLEGAYGALQVPYTRDGMLFIHRESHYDPGPSSLLLVWKDLQCSRYLSEAYPGLDPSVQVACLRVDAEGRLLTCDDPPVAIARGGAEDLAGVRANRSGFALFKVAGVHVSYADDAAEGAPAVEVGAVEFHAPAAANRVDADSLSKVLFQQAVRSPQPLTVHEIAAAAAAGAGMQQ